MSEPTGAEAAEFLNQHPSGWAAAMGLSFVSASADAVIAEWTVGPQHLQIHGIVHGGVHCGVIETVCSIGAALSARTLGKTAMGLENHTSFIRAVRAGMRLRATARPITRGRTTQVWEATIAGDDGKPVATGRVRLLCAEPEAEVAGRRLGSGQE